MFKKTLSIILVVSIVLLPIISYSETITLKKGQTAPFDGTLLDAEAIAKIISEKEYEQKKCELDKQYATDKQNIKCDMEKNVCKVEKDICNEKYNSVLKIKEEENKRLQELLIKTEKKNDNVIWWVIGGIALGVATSIGISYSINK